MSSVPPSDMKFDVVVLSTSPSWLSNFYVAWDLIWGHRHCQCQNQSETPGFTQGETSNLILLYWRVFSGESLEAESEGLGRWELTSLSDNRSFFSHLNSWDNVTNWLYEFITLPWCNNTCPNLGAKFGSRHFGPMAAAELLCSLSCSRKLVHTVDDAEMGGWGFIFLERVIQNKLEYLLVSLSVLSVPLLMWYRRDLCVPLPAQLIHIFPAVIYWKTETDSW